MQVNNKSILYSNFEKIMTSEIVTDLNINRFQSLAKTVYLFEKIVKFEGKNLIRGSTT